MKANPRLLVAFLLPLILFGCTKYESVTLTPADSDPPSVIIAYPYPGAVVSDTVTVRVLATDGSGVMKVILYLDGLPVEGAEDSEEPFELPWNTLGCKDSSTHVITVRAFDKSDNVSDSDPLICTVDHSKQYPKPVKLHEVVYKDDTFVVSWSPSKIENFKSYTLLESKSESMKEEVKIFHTENVSDTLFIVEDVQTGETRYYRVMTENSLAFSSISGVAMGQAQMPLPEGLVAYYPFNGNADDESGFDHHGTVIGPELTEDRNGKPASAYLFDMGDYIEITNHSDINFPGGFTLAAWVCPTMSAEHSNIISKVGPERDFVMQLNSDNRLNAHYDPTYAWYCHIYSEESLPLNKWTHVACVYEASTLKLYISGALVKEQSYGDEVPPWTGNVMLIGAMNYSENFFGKLDQVMVFGVPLTDPEIAQLPLLE